MKNVWKTALLLMSGAFLFACSNKESLPETPAGLVDVKSAVWSLEENPGSYTFWFSPTEGLEDVDVMKLADNYIKVVVPQTGENISLSDGNALVSYGKYNVQSSTLSEFPVAELSVVLPSDNTVKLSVKAYDAKGEGFCADFHGFCTKCPVVPEQNEKISFDRKAFFYFFGDVTLSGLRDYYIVLTDAPFTGATPGAMKLTGAGHILAIELSAIQREVAKFTLPAGTYYPAANYSNLSWLYSNTALVAYNASGSQDGISIPCKEITITEKDGVYTIKGSYQNSSLDIVDFEYVGELGTAEDMSSASDIVQ